ncbi:hypothetical protein CBU02nite_13950 [Clostridium butyricum]|uniref:Glycosyltransferase 2-like domain-containing protein n=1 Tax=Clostridium butyricum TaxID=1492 RepID=A0A512TKX3_CLOBU|nr:glycosyltransferase [Clostridium butyricum]NOW24200.1 GT2 family glycosyltransferase [Clostridium butyricum]GEQ20889.1 hypothetical protein CBU02nite_13950 [Clostridium butyricum]
MENMHVVAITVTFNRIKTLKNTINALANQSLKVDKIIIVDNFSNIESRNKLKLLEEYYDNIDVIYLNENKGGAGGFFEGMKYALEKYNPKWYWIMDDDAYPRPNCLNNLLQEEKEFSNIGALCPVVYGIDKNKYQMYHHKYISKYKINDITAVKDYTDLNKLTNIDANAFVGPLISDTAVRKCGLPKEELFIYGDDTEYTHRIAQKLELYLVKEAIIDHQDIVESALKFNPKVWWKDYYMIRNRFLFIDEFKRTNAEGVCSKTIYLLKIFKQMCAIIVKNKYKNYKIIRIKLLFKAITDGMLGKTGKTIDPSEFMKKISLKCNENIDV